MAINTISGSITAYQKSMPESGALESNVLKVSKISKESSKTASEKDITESKIPEASIKEPEFPGTILKNRWDFEDKKEEENSENPASKEVMKMAADEIKRKAKHFSVIYGIHEVTNRTTIKIVEKETKEVLKEYPPEQTLDMIAKIWELAGLVVDEKG